MTAVLLLLAAVAAVTVGDDAAFFVLILSSGVSWVLAEISWSGVHDEDDVVQ